MRLAPFAAVPLVVALAAAQEKRDVPTFSSGVELVTVDAVVVDREGRPVRGLAAADFALAEDGKPQAIASFEAFDLGAGDASVTPASTPGPVATNVRPPHAAAGLFVLLVDDMGLAPTRQETVRTALTHFLTDGVRDGDELVFATSSGDAWWSARVPEGREDLVALAARVRGRGLLDNGKDQVSEWEAFRITQFEGRDGGGGEGAATGIQGPASGIPVASVPGSSLTDRVVRRFYERRVCIPDFPQTPLPECQSMVRAKAREVDQRRVNRTRDVLLAVDRAVFALTGVRGRKSLLLLTEGFLNDPGLDAVAEVAGRCREANIAVYSLDVRGLIAGTDGLSAADIGQPNSAELGLMQMEQVEFQAAGSVGLAEDTGGFAVGNTNDLGGGASRIGEESRVYYLLGYAPPDGKGPRDWRKVKVNVKQPGLTVRARKGYTLRSIGEIMAASDARMAAKSRPARGKKGAEAEAPLLPTDVARALATAHDADAIPLRAMAYAFEGRPDGRVRMLVAVEADTHSLANLAGDERARSVLSLSISATHRDSGTTQRLDQRVEVDAGSVKGWEGWLALSRALDLLPGVNQARIVVRDEFLGRLGALTLRFVVPAESGLRISTPLLTDRVTAARPGEPSRPVLVAHREFDSGSPLFCQYQVFSAAAAGGTSPTVEASYELRRKDGDVVRHSEPGALASTSDGRVTGLVAMSLEGLPQGEYELVLRIEDKATAEKRERVEALRIRPR